MTIADGGLFTQKKYLELNETIQMLMRVGIPLRYVPNTPRRDVLDFMN